MCSTVDDEDRFISLINSGITSGVLTATAKWKKGSKDVKAKARRRDKASKEASEAEAYAKELGVHDKLYGDGGAKGGAKGKGKGKGKGKADDDEAGLRALIQGKQVERMDAMLESLEAKYGGPAKAKKGKKRGSTGGEEGEGEGGGRKRKKEVEPTEDEFARIQAEMDARRAKGRKSK
jgi:DnaJ family protein C protein 9